MTDHIKLSEMSNRGDLQSPEDCLKDALADVGKRGALEHGKKIIVLALDDANNEYNVHFYQAGMNMSQCIALAEVGKALFLQQMDFIPNE